MASEYHILAIFCSQTDPKETKITDFEKREYFMQHIILSSTSTRLGVRIKNLKTVKEMWAEVTVDATMKSTLFILDVEDQLSSMRWQIMTIQKLTCQNSSSTSS